jgi:hypothetical protein
VLQRHLGLGYQSAWAKSGLPSRRARNDFYTRVGKLVVPGAGAKQQLAAVQFDMEPERIVTVLEQSRQ